MRNIEKDLVRIKHVLIATMWVLIISPTWMSFFFVPPETFWQAFAVMVLQIWVGGQGLEITKKAYGLSW